MKSLKKCLAIIVLLSLLALGCNPRTATNGDARSVGKTAGSLLPSRNTANNSLLPSKSSFSFVVLGDSRPANSTLPQPRAFSKLIEQINRENPDLVFHTGDVVVGDTRNLSIYIRQYKDFLKTIGSLRTPYHISPGNHDTGSRLGQKAFKQTLRRDFYYSFDYKVSHFIILNTDMAGQEGRIEKNQLDWLKQDLENNKSDRHIFVMMHRPLYSVMNPEGKRSKHQAFTDKRNEYEIRMLMVKYQVEAVFAGHEHFFNKQIRDGVTYVITGAAGASPYADETHGGFYHYVKVRVNGDSIYMQVVKLGGQTLNPDSVLKPVFK